MCKLDLIADTQNPIFDTQEQLWLEWFFRNTDQGDFAVILTIFGTIFLMLVSIIALFTVMLLKDRFPKIDKTEQEPDGSVHIVPFLISIAASMMFILGLAALIGFILLELPFFGVRFNIYRLFTLPYDMVLLYAAVTAGLFTLVLRFSPNGSPLFCGWNRVCRNICLWILGIMLTVIAFFYCFYFFTLME